MVNNEWRASKERTIGEHYWRAPAKDWKRLQNNSETSVLSIGEKYRSLDCRQIFAISMILLMIMTIIWWYDDSKPIFYALGRSIYWYESTGNQNADVLMVWVFIMKTVRSISDENKIVFVHRMRESSSTRYSTEYIINLTFTAIFGWV